jgi:coenzyme F420-reducing hydrogenase beta subunit
VQYAPASAPTLSGAAALRAVIEGGCCIGCGACAALPASGIGVALDQYGRYVADLEGSPSNSLDSAAEVCPFTGVGPNETALATALFPQVGDPHPLLGPVLSAYAGYVSTGIYRSRGSSGGMVSWLLSELLKSGEVDAVAHVRPGSSLLYQYSISRTPEEIHAGSKSKYYPVTIARVLPEVRSSGLRTAIVGVPCFIKAVRLLSAVDEDYARTVGPCVSLFCGHLKSAAFADLLAWQCGIPPGHLAAFDFRVKLADRPASQYGVRAEGEVNGRRIDAVCPVKPLFGSDWGLGFMKYQACDYCDDLVGETADISVGDAWLPEYVGDAEGTNVVIVRSPLLQEMVEAGRASGQLHLDPLPADRVAASQAGGFRHRRAGLTARLANKRAQAVWAPPKRVEPDAHALRTREGRRALARERIALRSHTAFQEAIDANDLELMRSALRDDIAAYRRLSTASPQTARRVVSRLVSLWRRCHCA